MSDEKMLRFKKISYALIRAKTLPTVQEKAKCLKRVIKILNKEHPSMIPYGSHGYFLEKYYSKRQTLTEKNNEVKNLILYLVGNI